MFKQNDFVTEAKNTILKLVVDLDLKINYFVYAVSELV